MRRTLWTIIGTGAAVLLLITTAEAIRIKDIASIKGVRANQLVGYGIVAGLDGTGDDDKTEFTNQTLTNMLEKLGIVIDPEQIKIDNVAAVMVTASLPPFAKVGGRIDVNVASIGNAENLQGGTLLMTPLRGPDGEVYAVAQGPVATGGFSYGGESGTNVQKNHPTTGVITGGALIEKEVPLRLNGREQIEITLHNPDFTTCQRLRTSVASLYGTENVSAVDGGSVSVVVPEAHRGDLVNFIATLENLSVRPDTIARVVLNERTGTVVMGENVRISTVAVSHGSLSIIIKEQPGVSQPLPFSQGRTAVVPQTEIEVREEEARLALLEEGPTIGDVIRGLNAIGVTPRELMAILQAIKAAGALHAELEMI